MFGKDQDPNIGRKTQFGQPNGNPQASTSVAISQREFYRWVETKATLKELKDYADNEKNPAMRRAFVSSALRSKKMQDFFDLTNQTHGLPKQQFEIDNVPTTLVIKKS